MPLSDHLNARYDQANIRCLLQLHFKPLPLNLTQHGFLRVSIGQVTLFAWGISLIGDFGARFKPACVKENHLNTLPYRSKLIGVVETLSLPSQIVGRQLPKIHEGIFGHLFVWRLGATVVRPHVVVVPNGQMGNLFTQLGKACLCCLGGIGVLQCV